MNEIKITNSTTDNIFKINDHYRNINNNFKRLLKNNHCFKLEGFSDNDIQIVLEEITNPTEITKVDNIFNDNQKYLYQLFTNYKDDYDYEVKRFVDYSKFKSDYSNYFDNTYINTNQIILDKNRVILIDYLIEIIKYHRDNDLISNAIILFDYLQSLLKLPLKQLQILIVISIIITELIYFNKFDEEYIRIIEANSNFLIIFNNLMKIIPKYLNNTIFDNIFNHNQLIKDNKDNYLLIYYSKYYLKYSIDDLNDEIIDSLIEVGYNNKEKYINSSYLNDFIIRNKIIYDIIKFKENNSEKILLPEIEKINYISNKNIISSGTFGRIIKISDTEIVKEFYYKYNYLIEICYLSYLNHPNIIKLIGYGNDNGINGNDMNESIVLNYYQYSLTDYIYNNFNSIEYDIKINIILQIVTGLLYLHELNIYHLDIKSGNILVENNNNNDLYPKIKLIDFGYTKYNKKDIIEISNNFNFVCYFAPEFYIGDFPKYVKPSKIDVYLLAFIFIEIFSNKVCSELNKSFLDKNLEYFEYLENNDNNNNLTLEPMINQLLNKMMKINNFDRIDLKEIYQIIKKESENF